MILNKNNFYKHTFFKFFIILLGNITNGLMDFQFFSGHPVHLVAIILIFSETVFNVTSIIINFQVLPLHSRIKKLYFKYFAFLKDCYCKCSNTRHKVLQRNYTIL